MGLGYCEKCEVEIYVPLDTIERGFDFNFLCHACKDKEEDKFCVSCNEPAIIGYRGEDLCEKHFKEKE